MSLELRDQLAAQFASALARDDENPDAIAERAYELADAMLRERARRSSSLTEHDWEDEVRARSQPLEPTGADPRGWDAAPNDWMLAEPKWTQMALFEPEGLLGDAPPPPSERDFGEPEEEAVPEAPPWLDATYDPRWDAKPQWDRAPRPGLASARRRDAEQRAKASGDR